MSIAHQRTVLVVAADADFARQISQRWQNERVVPAFTVLGSVPAGFDATACDLAILGPLSVDALRSTLRMLGSGARPVMVVADQAETVVAETVFEAEIHVVENQLRRVPQFVRPCH